MQMQITFKSGTQVTVDVEDFSIGRSNMSGELRELKWTTPDQFVAKLAYLNLDEVSAIVRVEDPNMVGFTPEEEEG